MTTLYRRGSSLFIALACLGLACRLRPPDLAPPRMIEPQLTEPEPAADPAGDPISIRILDTQARGHIGRPLLHLAPGGELVEDPQWRWSSAPDRYLDSSLRLALAASADLRSVATASAPSVGLTLIAWHLESTSGTQLVGAVELIVTTTDRAVHTQLVRDREPVSGDIPGDLAAASGRLLSRLASESLARTTRLLR